MTNTPWLDDARADIGRYHDGPDVPKLAMEVAEVFPEMADYCRTAKNDTPWCGIFVAAKLAKYGIRPPFVARDELESFMWVNSWCRFGELVFGGEEKPGDIAIFTGNPHHVSFVAGNDKYVGGNQGDAVTEATYRRPNMVRRVPAIGVNPTPKPDKMKLSPKFERCIPLLLESEGGYSDHPDDPGGPTNFGITIEDARRYWKRDATAADMRNLPIEVAKDIFHTKYWDVLECDALPAGIDYAVFDYGVNSGVSRAAKVLQRIVGSEVDGEIGPNTITATRDAADLSPEAIINLICNERLAFLQGLSTWGVFGNGWAARVKRVRADALAMVGAIPMPPPLPEVDDSIKRIDAAVAELTELRARVTKLEDRMAKAINDDTTPAPVQPLPQIDVGAILELVVKVAPLVANAWPQLRPLVPLFALALQLLTGARPVPAPESKPSSDFPLGSILTSVGGVLGTVLSAVAAARGWVPPDAAIGGAMTGATVASAGGTLAAKKIMDARS